MKSQNKSHDLHNNLTQADNLYPAGTQQRTRRSKAYHEKRRRIRLFKRLGIVSIPFVFALAGLTLVSVGFFRYVEQESVLALFLVRRDSIQTFEYHGDDWNEFARPTDIPLPPMETHVIKPTEPESTDRLKVPFYYIGQQFATLRIPSVDIDVAVLQGDREREFKRGAGHYPGSFFPGQGGNILLAAHRTSYFRNFEYLEIGAEVYVETTYGNFVYRVDELRITEGDDQSIANDTPQEQLTMYTCYPFIYFGNAPQRFVVICSLVESEVNA